MGHTLCAVRFGLLFSLFLLELHVTEVHDGSNNFVAAILLLWSEAQRVHGTLHTYRVQFTHIIRESFL